MEIAFESLLLKKNGTLRKRFLTWKVPEELVKRFGLQDRMEFHLEVSLGRIRFSRWSRLTSGCEIQVGRRLEEKISDFAKLNPNKKIKFVLTDGLAYRQTEFEEKVSEALRSDPGQRAERLNAARKFPSKRLVTAYVYDRNPDVVAEVLYRARGHCEICGQSAPFKKRKDNSPYLEVHHKHQLADGGEDSVSNTIALCPNCHRKAHFGPREN